jgi:uncharacterized repeat protein (TIGR01451 family)
MIARTLRCCLFVSLIAGCAADDAAAPDPADADSGDAGDSFGAGATDPVKQASLVAKAKQLVRPGTVVQTEPRLGVPTFLWTRDTVTPASRTRWITGRVGRPEIAASRAVLADYAPLYGLVESDIASTVVASVHDRSSGPILVKLRAERGGIPIFREELNVILDRKLEAIAISGYLTSGSTPAARSGGLAFQLPAPSVAAVAVSQLAQTGIAPSLLVRAGTRDGYDYFTLAPAAGVTLDEPIRLKQVFYHLPDGLEAAYYVEVIARTGTPSIDTLAADGTPLTTTEAYGYVVSAATGAVLSRSNLISDLASSSPHESNLLAPGGFTYRVWADPVTGIPSDSPAGNNAHPKASPTPDGAQSTFVATSDVTLPNFPFSQNDPWIAPGSTQTTGNNVDAFLNLWTPDGVTPTTTTPTDTVAADYRAQITAAGQFLHTHTPDSNGWLAEGRQGSIQQLFYDINFLHDWFYDAGFNEMSGNAQTNNYGRGGLGADSIKAQAQDFQGFSNANMLTPADGTQPRMRMYVFPSPSNTLELLTPATIAGKKGLGISMSGPLAYDITNDLVIATFSNAPSSCTVTNAAALAGKIALFNFDNTDGTGCSFSTRISRITKTTSAQAMVMVYTSGNAGSVANITGSVAANTKPVATISWNTGSVIKAELAASTPVTARLYRAPDRDGAIDNQIIAHEWFHYASNRLIGNGSGLTTNLATGLGEGWSDFASLLLTVRADDVASLDGAYAVGTYVSSGTRFDGSANHGYYFGARRYPYSTDMAKNPLTYQHIANGVALPSGPALAFGASGANNAEVHNTGEVWASMLWECYAALLRDTLGPAPRLTFQAAQDRMKQYLIASLKVTPANPTINEARDALLAVTLASDVTDYIAFKRAFARRGAGVHAVSPDRFSATNVGVVEDFATGADLGFESATFAEPPGSCDSDGVVDHGEYGLLTLTLRNTGTTTLTATTATLSTPPGVWFPYGTIVSFPPTTPGATTTAIVRFAYLETVTGIPQLDFQVDYSDAQLASALTKVVSVRTNTDDILASTGTDAVESVATTWTTGFNATLGNIAPWKRIELTPMQHAWHVDDASTGSDQYLTTPVFTVDGSGSLGFQFDHSWSFEFDGGGNYDGGVVEMSVNGGAFADIGGVAYNGTIFNYPGTVNPLKGRNGFVKTSAGTVHTVLTQAIAPGSTVQIRFRAASDSGVGAAGWTIDDIALSGVVETPFATLVEDTGTCDQVPISTDLAITVTDAVTSVTVGGSVTYTITATNNGPDDVIGASVADAFSTDLACTWTCAAGAGSACMPSGTGDLYDRTTLPVGGSVTYTASCAVSSSATSTSLSNTATIAPPGPVTDLVPGNNAATDTDVLLSLPAELVAGKTVAGSFLQGEDVTYTIDVTNIGAGLQYDNPGNELLDVLPAGLTLVSATATSGTTTATPLTNTVAWNGSIASGGSVTVSIVATITAAPGTRLANQATFSFDSHGNRTNDASGSTDGFVCP